ncbi:MAG: hypothetical protein ABUS79_31085, partial [Pseudomonadota bacterium]
MLVVGDHEDHVGHQVRALATHLQGLGLAFEILAIDAGSRDASLGILQLLKSRIPQLGLSSAPSVRQAILRGVTEARGAVVLLVDPSAARPAPLGPLGWALSRLAA